MLILGVVVGDASVMAVFVLLLNPRLGADATKAALLDDPSFFGMVAERLLDVILSEKNLVKFEPAWEKLRQKIQGTIASDAAMDRVVDKMISKEIEAQNPDLGIAVDAIKQLSPKWGKLIEKRPELAPKIVAQARKRGLIPPGLLDEDEGLSSGITYS